jgi:hypothetical protein
MKIHVAKFTAQGYLIGYLWGGGEGGYPTRHYKAETREKLEAQVKKDFKSGALDSGMGFDGLKCAILDVTRFEETEVDGKKFYRTGDEDPIILGKPSAKDSEFLDQMRFQ